MSTPEIQSALQQIQQLATQAAGGRGQQLSTVVGGGGFAGELHASLQRINQLQARSSRQAAAFQAGAPEVALHDVMVDMQKASVAFQMGVQVRNRLVSAYKDVMNMQV
ncbi:flagellar hook-basal body complex protein (FliE) [Alcanivorax sp. S71-1-4]|jgi:flagellar hook-basal body complex protein FliE|uniref:flagellar hook-basal body complex protein FliE n=1 Tax=Alcanivorax sp. S71-1-4 TaxID=1177159 RepID=UPI00135B0572|nr:flagellar hook-basal body complex protein FliE [Alcanivorax sp. S71-1-4]KAF0808649.1 flagellar hook-basal body complex protein (FliE) [Alcanivorax sp. S71-1-4]